MNNNKMPIQLSRFNSIVIIAHARTLFNVVLEWLGRISAKIGLHRNIAHADSWEETIHRRADWNLSAYK
jgi:hypothetical protein